MYIPLSLIILFIILSIGIPSWVGNVMATTIWAVVKLPFEIIRSDFYYFMMLMSLFAFVTAGNKNTTLLFAVVISLIHFYQVGTIKK